MASNIEFPIELGPPVIAGVRVGPGINEDDNNNVDDWGSDFDDDYEESTSLENEKLALVQQQNSSMIELHYNCSVNGSLSSGFSSASLSGSGNNSASGSTSSVHVHVHNNKDESSSSGNSSLGSSISNKSFTNSNSNIEDDFYEIPDGKPAELKPTPVVSQINPVSASAQNSLVLVPKPPKPKPNAKPPKRPSSLPIGYRPVSASFVSAFNSLTVQPFSTTPTPTPTTLVTNSLFQNSTPTDIQTQAQAAFPQYFDQVQLPTRVSKEEDSKNFIDTLKRKLSQKNLHLKLTKAASIGAGISETIESTFKSTLKHKSNKRHSRRLSEIVRVDFNQSCLDIITTTDKISPVSVLSPSPSTPTSGFSGKKLTEEEATTVQVQHHQLNKFPWFYRVDRQKAELILENYKIDGSFLIRECQNGRNPSIPFTLTIRYASRFFHIQIRLRMEDGRFALGTMKLNETHFESVVELVDTYRKIPLQLHTNGQYFGETKLTQPPIVYSFNSK